MEHEVVVLCYHPYILDLVLLSLFLLLYLHHHQIQDLLVIGLQQHHLTHQGVHYKQHMEKHLCKYLLHHHLLKLW
jgi:hypothetical protein